MSIIKHSSIPHLANVSSSQWDDWHWQMKNVVISPDAIKELLSHEINLQDVYNGAADFPMKLTPFVILTIKRLINRGDLRGAKSIINAFIPQGLEAVQYTSNDTDGIGEERTCAKPAPLVTNFYKNRVLLFATNTCTVHCRFCFRRRKVGCPCSESTEKGTGTKDLERALSFIRQDKTIQEVIVSGGDPLTLSDTRLLRLLQNLKSIDHVKVLRIDTKTFTALPQRITPSLIEKVKALKPIYVVGNFMHPAELMPEVLNAASLMIDAGIPVFSHTPLLRGVNDDVQTLSELMWKLYVNRVIPYYMIQFIPTKWTEHFRVPIEEGLKIMDGLNKNLPGIACPQYIIYLPESAGKVPMQPNYLIEHSEKGYILRNFEGREVLYKENPIHDFSTCS